MRLSAQAPSNSSLPIFPSLAFYSAQHRPPIPEFQALHHRPFPISTSLPITPLVDRIHLLDNSSGDDLGLDIAQVIGVGEDIVGVGELAVAEEDVVLVQVIGVNKTKLEQKLLDLLDLPSGVELAVKARREAVEVELAEVVDGVEVGVAEAVALKLDQDLRDVVLVEAGVELAVEAIDVETAEELGDVVGGELVAVEQAVEAVAVELSV